MILIAALSAGVGWFASGIRGQRDAVAAIRRAGGHVVHDGDPARSLMPGQLRSGWTRLRLRYRALAWLADRVGVDSIDHPVHVALPARCRLEEAMPHIARLRRLDRRFVTGRGGALSLAPLEGLAELEVLVIRGAKIGPDGLAFLRDLAELRGLHLVDAGLTDASLEPIGGLGNLKDLNLEENALTGRGLARLGRLDQLQQLNLGRSFEDVTGEAVPDLQRRLPKVRVLVGNGVYGEGNP